MTGWTLFSGTQQKDPWRNVEMCPHVSQGSKFIWTASHQHYFFQHIIIFHYIYIHIHIFLQTKFRRMWAPVVFEAMTEGLPDQPACLAAGSEYLLQTGKFLEVCLFFVELVELDEVPINTGMGFLSRLFKIGDVTWFSYVFLSKTTNIMETWAFSMAMAFPKTALSIRNRSVRRLHPEKPRASKGVPVHGPDAKACRRWSQVATAIEHLSKVCVK